ncbi:MAG: proprotein convertase P-domain-containing protein [Solirubrobacterales bacterium]
MVSRIYFPAVILLVLFLVSGPVRGEATSIVYTYGGAFDLRIPEDPAATCGWMRTAMICVPDHILICDVDVRVNIRHAAALDLQLSLQGPSGREIVLNTGDMYEHYYEGEDYDSTTFDDEATVPIQDVLPPFAGNFRPIQALSIFDGGDACGVWRLWVHDMYYGDTGRLNSFVLIVTGPMEKEIPAVPLPAAGGLSLLGAAMIAFARRLSRLPGEGRRPARGPSAPVFS